MANGYAYSRSPRPGPQQKLFYDDSLAECGSCRAIKPHSEFLPVRGRGKRSRAVQHRCSDCEKERWYQRRYGVSRQVYLDLHAEQDGQCAICKRRTALVLDHCHETGVIRGLLCRPCNKALHWIEREDWMAAARGYIGRRKNGLKIVGG